MMLPELRQSVRLYLKQDVAIDHEAAATCGYDLAAFYLEVQWRIQMGVVGVSIPSFLVGVAYFFEMVLVLSEADESEYVISNVLSNVLVSNYLSFKVNGRNILVT